MKQTDIQHYWELLWGMTEKELRARYKHTMFGFVWLVANPVLQMLVIGFIFPLFIKSPIKQYHSFLFTGLLAWNFFSLSLSKTTSSIVNERSLIKKAIFPQSIIPVSIILSNLINYLVAFIIFFIPNLIFQSSHFVSVYYFFCGLGMLLTFTVGISLLTSALNVRFRDISFFVQALLIVWFYATPIIYSLSQVSTQYFWIWYFNPLTSIIQLLQASSVGSSLPDLATLCINSCMIIAIFVFGILIFKKESKNFDDWL